MTARSMACSRPWSTSGLLILLQNVSPAVPGFLDLAGRKPVPHAWALPATAHVRLDH
jgi:hypothetical protein